MTVALMLGAGAGCSRKESPENAPTSPQATATEPAAAPPVSEATPPADEPEPPVTDGRLAGTSWRLVQIMSMDDTTHTPDDPSLYTLEFGSDGTASIRADCNRGSGTWASESESQLQFGVIAATQAQCEPDSLHDQYMSQFEWVRSYVMKDGHLFLATMADGSIIEFEPASP